MDEVIKRLNNIKDGILHICGLNLTQLPSSTLWVNVRILDCTNNQLTSLPELPNVKYLHCSRNQLTRLPDLPNIEFLHCGHNQLTTLPDLPNVKELSCGFNQLTILPDLPNIRRLFCFSNPLPYNPKNRKVFNAIFRLISARKVFKQWKATVRRRQQEKIYQIINNISRFEILPVEIKLYIINFI